MIPGTGYNSGIVPSCNNSSIHFIHRYKKFGRALRLCASEIENNGDFVEADCSFLYT